MARSFDEWEEKINSTDTKELVKVQEELNKAKNDDEITNDEHHRLMDFVKQRLGGFKL